MTVQLAGPGKPLPAVQAGDFYLTYSKSWIGLLIRFGERLHRKDPKYTWCSHAGLIMDDKGNLIEALSDGLTAGNLSKYAGQRYAVVRPPLGTVQRQQAIAYAKDEMARHPAYGWLDAASVVFQMLTPMKLDTNWDGTLICSAFVARALEHGGYVLATNSPFVTTPGDLAAMFDVLEPAE